MSKNKYIKIKENTTENLRKKNNFDIEFKICVKTIPVKNRK